MSAADELAQALRQLAVGEDDFQLADLLIETVQKIEQHGQHKLREQAQGVIGESYVTIQERLDALLNIGRDTHQLVMAVQAEFQQVAESVDHLTARDAQQYAESRADREQLNHRLGQAEQQIAALRARMDARPSPEQARATYDGVQRILAHLNLALDESDHAAER